MLFLSKLRNNILLSFFLITLHVIRVFLGKVIFIIIILPCGVLSTYNGLVNVIKFSQFYIKTFASFIYVSGKKDILHNTTSHWMQISWVSQRPSSPSKGLKYLWCSIILYGMAFCLFSYGIFLPIFAPFASNIIRFETPSIQNIRRNNITFNCKCLKGTSNRLN